MNKRMVRLMHKNNGNYSAIISKYKTSPRGLIVNLLHDKDYQRITRSSAIRLSNIIHAHVHDFNIGRYSMDIFAVIIGRL